MLIQEKCRVVGFDLDGTLIDSKDDILHCLREVLHLEGLDSSFVSQVRIGPPFREMILPFIGGDLTLANKLHSSFRQIYDHNRFPKTSKYQLIDATLAMLKERRIKMYVATSKSKSGTDQVFNHVFFDHPFSKILSIDTYPNVRLSKIEMVAECIRHVGEPGERSLYVGDAASDIKAARLNGAISVAVTYGYSSEEELAAENPDYMVKDTHSLKGLLDRLTR